MEMLDEIAMALSKISNLKTAYLFGSRTGQNFRAESDYDICFVLTSADKEPVYQLVTDLSIKHQTIIHPLVLTEHEFAERIKMKPYRQLLEGRKLLASR